eukprot:363784-Chlamydomonas_euryale.AAC.6
MCNPDRLSYLIPYSCLYAGRTVVGVGPYRPTTCMARHIQRGTRLPYPDETPPRTPRPDQPPLGPKLDRPHHRCAHTPTAAGACAPPHAEAARIARPTAPPRRTHAAATRQREKDKTNGATDSAGRGAPAQPPRRPSISPRLPHVEKLAAASSLCCAPGNLSGLRPLSLARARPPTLPHISTPAPARRPPSRSPLLSRLDRVSAAVSPADGGCRGVIDAAFAIAEQLAPTTAVALRHRRCVPALRAITRARNHKGGIHG